MKSTQASFRKFTLKFLRPMGTSRGIMHEREVIIVGISNGDCLGLGECAPLAGLSVDDMQMLEPKLEKTCALISRGAKLPELDLASWPAVRFAVETAFADLRNGGRRRFFESNFTNGETAIAINGLVLMGGVADMLQQAHAKVASGHRCIKLKIGALDFDAECELLRQIRRAFPAESVELRLDANGAFAPDSALQKIDRLAEFGVHSLEQPIKPGQPQALAEICKQSTIPIALDEELIGINSPDSKASLVERIQPAYLILKPTLLGGLVAAQEWIDVAVKMNCDYWITSMLESGVGHNVLCQWTGTLDTTITQGLGSGSLYRSNFESSVYLSDGYLRFQADRNPDPIQNLSELLLKD